MDVSVFFFAKNSKVELRTESSLNTKYVLTFLADLLPVQFLFSVFTDIFCLDPNDKDLHKKLKEI